MAIDFPSSPVNGQSYADPGTGQTWTYELANNSWTATSLATTGGIVYKGSVDITAAPPVGAKAGEQWSVSVGGTANAGYGPGITGTVLKGDTVLYTGSGWLRASSSIPDATEVAKGIVELATAAETTTGTDATRAVHPAGLKSALTFTQAGADAKPRSYNSKFRDVVSVKDFGAVGDATTDDTDAIQAAFTYASSSGYAIYIPSGTYRITVPIRTGMAGPALKIYGDGSLHSTIVQQTAGANGIEHDYNPITVAVAGTTCTVTSAHPHGLSSGSISLPSNKGPVSRLPKAFLGPKTIAVTSPTVFTFTVAGGTTTPGSQTGFLTPAHARAISIEGIAVKAGQLPGGIADIKGGAAFIVALEGSGPNTSQWNDVLVCGWNANGSNGWEKGAVVYGPTGLRWSNIVMQGRNSFSEKPSAECVGITLSTYSSQGAGSSGPVDGAYNAKFI